MKHRRTLSVALLGLLSLAASSPALEWTATRLSVTTAPFQSTQAAVFSFRNTGAKTVAIRDVQTSCDCLEAKANRATVPPGESGEIHATFTIGDRFGAYERIITVVTDEPGDSVRLLLQIEVPPVASLAPRSVAWPVQAAPTEKFLNLTAADGLEIIFREAVSTNADFAVALETVEPGQHYLLRVRPRSTAQPAAAAIRLFGREKSGHEVVISAYASVE